MSTKRHVAALQYCISFPLKVLSPCGSFDSVIERYRKNETENERVHLWEKHSQRTQNKASSRDELSVGSTGFFFKCCLCVLQVLCGVSPQS